jgi:hypothetical protein
MPKYRCHAPVTVSAYTIVNAVDMDMARRIAYERDVVLGGVGSGFEPSEVWVIEDADGNPTLSEITVEP